MKEKNLIEQAPAQSEPKKPRRKRHRKKPAAQAILIPAAEQAAPVSSPPDKQQARSVEVVVVQPRRRKKYEADQISNRKMPGVKPFLEDWEGSAPISSVPPVAPKAPPAPGPASTVAAAVPTVGGQKPPRKSGAMAKRVSADKVISELRKIIMPITRESLAQRMGLQHAQLYPTLDAMLQSGSVFLSRKGRYALPEQLGYVRGKLQTTQRGSGFVLPEDNGSDIFINSEQLMGAMDGDTVYVRIIESEGNSRRGEIVSIDQRVNTRLVGTLARDGRFMILIPDNSRIQGRIIAQKGRAAGAVEGQKVLCTLTFGETLTAQIDEVLGWPGDAGTDTLAIIRSHGIPEEFSPKAQRAAEAAPKSVSPDEIVRREDLRAATLVTIDGADAKDLDDAISLTKLQDGSYYLGVHIADVTHYVHEGAPLDTDAYERGTSVYFTDRVIPMLPTQLSNGICSLNEAQDRLALSCFMMIDKNGIVQEHRIAETVIRSRRRLNYTQVNSALDHDDSGGLEDVFPMLQDMRELAAKLCANRQKRGAMDFDLPEAKVKLDEHGKPVSVDVYARGVSNRMIEEFMLCANETVAAHMSYLELPIVYRVHEPPDSEKLRDLAEFLHGFGISLKPQHELHPKMLQGVLDKVAGKSEEAVVGKVVLRSMKKARYSQSNLGHFGLAAEHYCHFTSPIRRYPDLITHRIIKDLLHGRLPESRVEQLNKSLVEVAKHCSERERSAMEAEREIVDLKKCEYMATKLGEEFDGVISGVTGFGFFVELPNTCEGLVRVSDLPDYYIFDEKNYRLVGRASNKVFRLGDHVTVKVAGVDTSLRRVDFAVVEEKVPHGRRPRRRYYKPKAVQA